MKIKIVKNFLRNNKLQKLKLGKNYIYCYSLRDFYNSNLELLKKYIFLDEKKSFRLKKIQSNL